MAIVWNQMFFFIFDIKYLRRKCANEKVGVCQEVNVEDDTVERFFGVTR